MAEPGQSCTDPQCQGCSNPGCVGHALSACAAQDPSETVYVLRLTDAELQEVAACVHACAPDRWGDHPLEAKLAEVEVEK